MKPAQHEHFREIMYVLRKMAQSKYEKGAIEHNSNLWEFTDEELFIAETEEMIDLLMYRLTRILKNEASNN